MSIHAIVAKISDLRAKSQAREVTCGHVHGDAPCGLTYKRSDAKAAGHPGFCSHEHAALDQEHAPI